MFYSVSAPPAESAGVLLPFPVLGVSHLPLIFVNRVAQRTHSLRGGLGSVEPRNVPARRQARTWYLRNTVEWKSERQA